MICAVREKHARIVQEQHAASGHHLAAVDESEPFLVREAQRLQPGFAQSFAGGERLAREAHVSFADQRQRHVRERSQISARSERTLRRNHRKYVMLEHRLQPLDQNRSNSGESLGEEVQLEEENGADFVVGERRAHAGGVAAHDIDLQILEVRRGDDDVREMPDPGVDPVDDAPFADAALEKCAAALDPLHRRRRNACGRTLAGGAHHVGEPQPVPLEHDHRRNPLGAHCKRRAILPAFPESVNFEYDACTR